MLPDACLIAALLYSVQYMSAAIFGSGVSSWNPDVFPNMLEKYLKTTCCRTKSGSSATFAPLWKNLPFSHVAKVP
jgi:hypothetical protein